MPVQAEPTRKPTHSRLGDCWQFLWNAHGVGIRLEHPKEGAYGITAEIAVETLSNGHAPGHLHWSRVKISDAGERDRLAKVLHSRTSEGGAYGTSPVPWALLLEQACTIVAREHRQGEEVKLLREVEVQATREWLVRRLLPAGETSLFYADGGSGKSVLALLLGLAVQAGQAMGGLEPTRATNVLYLDWETHERVVRRRQRALCRGLGTPEPDLRYLRMTGPLATSAVRIAAELERWAIGLLIIDSAGFAAGGDINDAATATELYNTLRGFGVTCLVLHHVNKAAAASDGPTKPNGTAYWWNGARNAWEIRSVQEPDLLTMSLWQRKDNDGGVLGQPLGLTFQWSEEGERITVGRHDAANDPELVQYGGHLYILLHELQGGAKTTKELADATGIDPASLRVTLNRSKRVVRIRQGGGNGNDTLWGLASYD